MTYRLIGISILLAVLLLVAGCGGGGEQQGIAATSQAVAPASVVGPAQDSSLLGDMDNDGEPSVGDAIRILRIVVGLDPDDPCADANKNGGTDVGDGRKVLRCVVGLDDGPIGECGLDARIVGIWRATAAWVNGATTADIAGAWGYNEFGDALQVVFLNTGRCSDQAYNDGDPIANEAGSWLTSNWNVTIDWDGSGRQVYGYEFTDADETCWLTFAIGGDVIEMRLEKQQ